VHDGRVPLFAFEGHSPSVDPAAWIAPTATLVGDVRVEAEASIWYGPVLRADFGPIIVRRGANVQDGSIMHGGEDPVTEIGEGATVGHLCVVHGAVIGAEALIGNGATVLDGAVVGRRALIAAGATVPPGMIIGDGMLAVGVPARVVGETTAGARMWVDTNPAAYRDLARRHAASVRPVLRGALGSAGPADHGIRARTTVMSSSQRLASDLISRSQTVSRSPCPCSCSWARADRSASMPCSAERVRLSTSPSEYRARMAPGGSLMLAWP
jgi:carbonic anhydrase/acetyltransferase-like protein (isoleucine patch superfamily)